MRGEKKLHQAVKDMHRPKGSCTNPNKDKPTADWPEMIKWCARQKAVSKGSLMERYSNNEGDCRKRLAIAAQTAGYIVTYLGDGEYRVRKAITLATDSADQKEHATHLRDTRSCQPRGRTSHRRCDERTLPGGWSGAAIRRREPNIRHRKLRDGTTSTNG